MTEKPDRKVQYLAGLSAAFTFTFAGATVAWPSAAIPKLRNGEANIVITHTQTSWVVSLHSAGALLGCYFGQVLNEKAGRRRTFFSAVPALLGAVIILNTSLPELMYVARFLMGVATGIIAVMIEDQMRIMRAHVRESMENKTNLKELLTNMRYRKAVYIVTDCHAIGRCKRLLQNTSYTIISMTLEEYKR